MLTVRIKRVLKDFDLGKFSQVYQMYENEHKAKFFGKDELYFFKKMYRLDDDQIWIEEEGFENGRKYVILESFAVSILGHMENC